MPRVSRRRRPTGGDSGGPTPWPSGEPILQLLPYDAVRPSSFGNVLIIQYSCGLSRRDSFPSASNRRQAYSKGPTCKYVLILLWWVMHRCLFLHVTAVRPLQAYFSLVLEEQRELWDASADIEAFFFPGPPTSYSAALSRRRSEQLKVVSQQAARRQPPPTPLKGGTVVSVDLFRWCVATSRGGILSAYQVMDVCRRRLGPGVAVGGRSTRTRLVLNNSPFLALSAIVSPACACVVVAVLVLSSFPPQR